MENKKKKIKLKKSVIIIGIVGIFFILCALFLIIMSQPVDKNNTKDIYVEIKSGTSTPEIGTILKDKELIKSKLVFNIYALTSFDGHLQAGNFKLNQTMSTNEIIKTMTKGSNYNPDNISITFKEGERLTDYAELIAEHTNHTYEDVINVVNDKTYLQELINKYWFLEEDILNDEIYYPLEGYLAPNTYFFENKDVKIETIIEDLLDEEEKILNKYKDQIISNNLNVHEVLTMASTIQLEGTNEENRKMIAGVFYNRLESGYNMGSDVTTYYGLQMPMTQDLTSAQFQSVNAYNTRSNTMIKKLPVGPICNPEEESILSTLNYTKTDYLFFVADKNGKIYYAKTESGHQQNIANIKKAGNWIW